MYEAILYYVRLLPGPSPVVSVLRVNALLVGFGMFWDLTLWYIPMGSDTLSVSSQQVLYECTHPAWYAWLQSFSRRMLSVNVAVIYIILLKFIPKGWGQCESGQSNFWGDHCYFKNVIPCQISRCKVQLNLSRHRVLSENWCAFTENGCIMNAVCVSFATGLHTNLQRNVSWSVVTAESSATLGGMALVGLHCREQRYPGGHGIGRSLLQRAALPWGAWHWSVVTAESSATLGGMAVVRVYSCITPWSGKSTTSMAWWMGGWII